VIRRTLIVIGIGVLLANVLVDWMMGCGGHYRDSRGIVQVERCSSFYLNF